MSALLAPLEQARTTAEPTSAPLLQAVPASPLRLSRVGFIIFVTTLLGAGMVGILLLNTTIQQRAQQVAAAQRTADDLGYRQASLTARVEQLRSSSDLATRAWELGLRPNPNPVFVQLGADGKPGRVIGDPVRVTGNEMPDQRYVGADEVTSRIDKARASVRAQRAAEAARREAAAKAAAEKARLEKLAAERKAQAAKQAKAATTDQKAGQAAAKASTAPKKSGTGGH